MKYGRSKYNTIKYGVYSISEDSTFVTFKPVTKVRIRSRDETSISQTIIVPMTNKVRVNGMIAYTFTINGCYNKIRIKSNSEQKYNIAKVVSI